MSEERKVFFYLILIFIFLNLKQKSKFEVWTITHHNFRLIGGGIMMHRIGDLRAESYPYLGLGQNQILVVGATGEWGGGMLQYQK